MFPTTRGLGDVWDDLTSVAGAIGAASTPGGMAAWLQKQLVAFQALPNDITALRGQIARVQSVLTGVNVSSQAQENLNVAQSDVAQMTAQYPAVNLQMGQVVLALAPLMPAIQAGTLQASQLTPLLGNGMDIVGAFHGVNDLVSLRDDARRRLNAIVSDNSLPPGMAAQVANALTSTTVQGLLKIGLVAGAGYMLLKLFRRR